MIAHTDIECARTIEVERVVTFSKYAASEAGGRRKVRFAAVDRAEILKHTDLEKSLIWRLSLQHT